MTAPSPTGPMPTPISLPFETLDDLIYSARAGDLEALKSDITTLSTSHNCAAAQIIESAIDAEDESEGGTGSCLLHWPAANGNIEILNYLLSSLKSTTTSPLINHKNHSGNTPLHWAALNIHLDCVKALVEAGADVDLKNNAGHDAAFLAERADWSSSNPGEEGGNGNVNENETEGEKKDGDEDGESKPASKGVQVIELLLNHEGEVKKDEDGDEDGKGKEKEDGDGDTNMES